MSHIKSKKVFKLFSGLMIGLTLLAQSAAYAVAIDWNGHYRFDYVDIDRSEMTSGSHKSYFLNNLVLMPHLLPTDGVEVIGKIHLTENNDPRYANSQMGMIWGNSHNTTGAGTYTDDSNTMAPNRPKTSLALSQLYLKLNQEWGSIIVGRAPMQFGLGITHNAGLNPFSHWFDTRDIFAYKVHIDNLFIMPSISKQFANDYIQGGEITNQTLHLEYKNPDTGDWLGLLYETSRGNKSVNDIPLGTARTGTYNITSYNVILGKDFSDFGFKIEGGFQSGNTGAVNGTNEIKLNTYAVVSEFDIKSEASKNNWKIKLGSVSGDNPETDNFEGYLLDRNYDIALLLFNHSLGQNADIFKTGIGHPTAASFPGIDTSFRNRLDDEYVSNVLFVAPQWNHQLADRWFMRNTLVFARLNNSLTTVGAGVEKIDSNVGVEWDLGFSYKANDNVEWKFDSGVLSPGKAFEMGSAGLKTSTIFGLMTSAAITF